MLSPQAEKLIQDYLNLPFREVPGVRCPYLNNAGRNRGQLRVLIGKGTPAEIVEEAKIISLQYHHGLFEKSGRCCLLPEHQGKPETELIRKFLIDNRLGVDCSGLASHVLRAHFLETAGVNIFKKFHLVPPRNFLRWLITRFRPVESMGVGSVFANDKNTVRLGDAKSGFNFAELKPADLIILLQTGPLYKRNHLLIITENDGRSLRYLHSRAWTTEGQYGHGVYEGKIEIVKPSAGLLEQIWTEKGLTGDQNETYLEAKRAKVLEIRRVKA